MEKRTFKDAIYGDIARLVRGMSNAHRLEILDLLANGPKSVEQIANETAISAANASQHLQVLKGADLVTSRREGNFIFYALANVEVYRSWQAIRELGITQAPRVRMVLDKYRESLGSNKSITLQDLVGMENYYLVDVRPVEEYAAGHLPGATSIPIWMLSERLAELPKDQMIVTYCRGPFCTYADEAVRLLHQAGLQAIRLEENFIDYDLQD